jgi:hypothetical protein
MPTGGQIAAKDDGVRFHMFGVRESQSAVRPAAPHGLRRGWNRHILVQADVLPLRQKAALQGFDSGLASCD